MSKLSEFLSLSDVCFEAVLPLPHKPKTVQINPNPNPSPRTRACVHRPHTPHTHRKNASSGHATHTQRERPTRKQVPQLSSEFAHAGSWSPYLLPPPLLRSAASLRIAVVRMQLQAEAPQPPPLLLPQCCCCKWGLVLGDGRGLALEIIVACPRLIFAQR